MFFAYSDLHPVNIIEDLENMFSEIQIDHISAVAVLTGGAEEKFLKAFKEGKLSPPIAILAHESQNSLPAAAEIMAYLFHRDIPSHLFLIPHEKDDIEKADKLAGLLQSLESREIGILDEPSPWLISASTLTPYDLQSQWGLTIRRITWHEFLEIYHQEVSPEEFESFKSKIQRAENILVSDEELIKQTKMYKALKFIHEKYNLVGLSVKCFHLLNMLGTVPCLAFSILNSENYVLGCEGDIPALIGMIISKQLTSKSGFIANLNWFYDDNKVLMSHCTSPISLLEKFYIPTHFESGKGAAVKGYYPKNMDVTLLKILPNGKLWHSRGTIVNTPDKGNICRTQVVIKVPEENYTQLRSGKLGNHTVIVPADISSILKHLSWLSHNLVMEP